MTRHDVIENLPSELAHRAARAARLAGPTEDELAADEDAPDLIAGSIMLVVRAACDIASCVIPGEVWRPASSLAEDGVVSERKLGQRTIYQLARQGRMGGAARIGGQRHFDKTALMAWLEAGGETREREA